jgi:sugar phosphate isomerase/epimerase
MGLDPRIGFVTQMGMALPEALDRAGALGLDYVEVMVDGEGSRARLASDADALATRLDRHDLGLAVHLPFGGVDPGSPHEHVREGACRELEATIDAAAALGADRAVLHGASAAWGAAWDASDVREPLLASIERLDAHAAARGVEVCVENVPGGFVATSDLPDLLAGTDVSMTLDTGHARIDGYDAAGLANYGRANADRIAHVHLNDTRRPRDEHLPFGAGDVDFAGLFDALADGADGDWTGTLSLEVFTLDYGYVATSVERLRTLL